MNNKALYWIALGVFALGFSSEYQQGRMAVAHGVAERAGALFCKIASRAEHTLAVARVLTGRQQFADDRFVALKQAEVDRVLAEHQAEMARAMALRQADLERIQRRLDRVHIVMNRAQMSKVRILERTRFKLSNATTRHIVVCPETGARVSVLAPDADVADLSVDVDND